MKRILMSVLILFMGLNVTGQVNLELKKQLTYNQDLSDVWGYVDGQGNEYALVGVYNGVSIVDVSDPENAVEVAFVSDYNSIWHDLKTWEDHAYVTNEDGGGLLIIDLSSLPDASGITSHRYDGPEGNQWHSAHNLFIDEFGYAYIFGADRDNGGAIFLDLTDPDNPVEVGSWEESYIHDGMAKNNKMYVGNIYAGKFSMVDVSDKANPVTLGGHETPGEFTHNCWVSDDGNYVYTTDEIAGGYIAGYNISDMTDIVETDRIQANPGSGTIVHNTHFMNEFLITSYYKEGVTIHDVSDPENIVITGQYDTSPFEGNGFAGAWGAYPFLPSGLILVTDIEEGLFVLQPVYVRAARIEGIITDANLGTPLFGATVSIEGQDISNTTDLSGNYKLGISEGGIYTVNVSLFGYEPLTITNIELFNDSTVVMNIELESVYTFTFSGLVQDMNATGVEGAKVLVYNDEGSFQTETDADGTFSIENFIPGIYTVIAEAWGMLGGCILSANIYSEEVSVGFLMNAGITDTYTFDFGWTVNGTALTGTWERGIPQGTYLNGVPANPDYDSPSDCQDYAYITGNSGGGVGADDVDDGDTWLISPQMDVSGYNNPTVIFDLWFFNGGGNTNPNDSLIVYLRENSGTDWIPVYFFTDDIQWETVSFVISDYIDAAAATEMQVAFTTADQESTGHIVEAGVDNFRILNYDITEVAEIEVTENLKVYPNPSRDGFFVEIPPEFSGENTELEILDLSGKRIYKTIVMSKPSRIRVDEGLENGTYILKLTESNGNSGMARIMIVK